MTAQHVAGGQRGQEIFLKPLKTQILGLILRGDEVPGPPVGWCSQGWAGPAGAWAGSRREGLRGAAAASAQVQGWKLPDRRAEQLPPSLPPSLPSAGLGREPCRALPGADAFGGRCTAAAALPEGRRAAPAASCSRAAALGWAGAAQSVCLSIAELPVRSCKDRPQLTAPHSPPQHQARLLCRSYSSSCHQPGPPSSGDGPWGSHSPQSPRVAVPRAAPQCPQQLSPGLGCAGWFVLVPALPCAVPGPRGRTCADKALLAAALPAAPRAVPAPGSNYQL